MLVLFIYSSFDVCLGSLCYWNTQEGPSFNYPAVNLRLDWKNFNSLLFHPLWEAFRFSLKVVILWQEVITGSEPFQPVAVQNSLHSQQWHWCSSSSWISSPISPHLMTTIWVSWSVALCLRNVWDAPVAAPSSWAVTITPASHSRWLPGGLFNPVQTAAPCQSFSHPLVVTWLLAKLCVRSSIAWTVLTLSPCAQVTVRRFVPATCLSSCLFGCQSVPPDLVSDSSVCTLTDTLPLWVPRSGSGSGRARFL